MRAWEFKIYSLPLFKAFRALLVLSVKARCHFPVTSSWTPSPSSKAWHSLWTAFYRRMIIVGSRFEARMLFPRPLPILTDFCPNCWSLCRYRAIHGDKDGRFNWPLPRIFVIGVTNYCSMCCFCAERPEWWKNKTKRIRRETLAFRRMVCQRAIKSWLLIPYFVLCVYLMIQ